MCLRFIKIMMVWWLKPSILLTIFNDERSDDPYSVVFVTKLLHSFFFRRVVILHGFIDA